MVSAAPHGTIGGRGRLEAPDGATLANLDRQRAEWYLRRGLALLVHSPGAHTHSPLHPHIGHCTHFVLGSQAARVRASQPRWLAAHDEMTLTLTCGCPYELGTELELLTGCPYATDPAAQGDETRTELMRPDWGSAQLARLELTTRRDETTGRSQPDQTRPQSARGEHAGEDGDLERSRGPGENWELEGSGRLGEDVDLQTDLESSQREEVGLKCPRGGDRADLGCSQGEDGDLQRPRGEDQGGSLMWFREGEEEAGGLDRQGWETGLSREGGEAGIGRQGGEAGSLGRPGRPGGEAGLDCTGGAEDCSLQAGTEKVQLEGDEGGACACASRLEAIRLLFEPRGRGHQVVFAPASAPMCLLATDENPFA